MLAISDPRAYIASLKPDEKAQLDALLKPELAAKWLPDPRNEPQLQAYYSEADLMLFGGAAGGGKALYIKTPIPVPSGWKSMGELQVGDNVFDNDGKVCRITAVSPVMIGRRCFEIGFSDGNSIVADAEHGWFTFSASERMAFLRQSVMWRAKRRSRRLSRSTGKWSRDKLANAARPLRPQRFLGGVRTTLELSQTIFDAKRLNHSVAVCGPLDCDDIKLPIEPYLLGAWLGDGTSSGARITMAEPQMVELFSQTVEQSGWKLTKGSTKLDYGVVGGLRVALRAAGLIRAKAIPEIYLRSSIMQRIALLQGLMDTDGYADARGQCEFSVVSEKLAFGVLELIRSLGCKANISIGDAKLNGRLIGPKYRIKFLASFQAFRIDRKLKRQKTAGHRSTVFRRYIESIREISSVPVKCISVDSPSRQYLCGYGMVPTHNSDLLCGIALNNHQNAVIFRKQSTDLRGLEERLLALAGRDGWNGQQKTLRTGNKLLELGHLERPGSEESWRGRPHDFIGFDEGAQLGKQKVRFVLGWLRSVDPQQRRRMIIASNPPTGGEGEWLIEWFAPWLDPKFSKPAVQGELRWAVTGPDRDGSTVWVPDGAPIVFKGDGLDWRYATEAEINAGDDNTEVVQPQTRTFIQSLLRNNPYLANTGYRAQIQALPEPLRSQLLNGDFVVGREDHEWQVIPTAWVRAAQERWRPTAPSGAQMTAVGVDVAQGGADRTVLAPRFGPWYGSLIERPGILTPTGSSVAALVVEVRRNSAVIVMDMGGGYGGAAKERLNDNRIDVRPFNAANSSNERTKDKQLSFFNKRAEIAWRFREALDPDQDGGSPIALPPDPQLLADLTSPRWKLTPNGILVEPKDDLKKPDRLGRSPDKGDAVMMAWSEGEKGMVIAMKKAMRVTPAILNKPSSDMPTERGTGWMARR